MILSLVVAAWAADDCSLSETDYYQLRAQLRSLRQFAGYPVGIAPAGPQCAKALEAVLRNGPFLGVHEVPAPSDDPCVARLEPGDDGTGWQLAMNGQCRDAPRGPAGILSVGPWLPYGLSARYNRDIGNGLSVLADFGWAPPRFAENPFDFTLHGTENTASSSMRGLIGVDMAKLGLGGTYFGVRGGIELATPVDGPIPRYGTVSFVGGRKWMANGVALQAGGGLLCEMPMLLGPQPSLLSPVVELRIGLTNRL